GVVVAVRPAPPAPASRAPAGRADPPPRPGRGVDALPALPPRLVRPGDPPRLAVTGVADVEDAAQRNVLAHHGGGERLGDPVPERVREAEHPGGVLHRGLGLDGAVGDDLGDPVVAVLFRDVPDDITAPTFI